MLTLKLPITPAADVAHRFICRFCVSYIDELVSADYITYYFLRFYNFICNRAQYYFIRDIVDVEYMYTSSL